MNSWKQPTPTDINENENLNFIDRSIFREILSRCRNEDGVVEFTHAGRNYNVELARGQCILKASKLGHLVKGGRRRVQNSIAKVSKWYSPLHNKGMPFGLVITVLDYDNLVSMNNSGDNRRTIAVQKKNNRSTANKSVETDKTDKSVYILSKFFQEKIKKTATLNDKAREKIRTRLKVFSVDDLRRAITNFSGDWWQMENNSHRPMSWFFHSDERIEGYRDMRPREAKYKTPDGRGFESKDKFLAYMESKGWEVRL